MAADLNAIQLKVRRLTRNPSEQQLSNVDITEYVNTFYQYDLPEELRLFSLKSTLSFFTEANVDTYSNNQVNVPGLANFLEDYITIDNPVYCAGQPIYLSQSREEFYGYFPQTSYRATIGTGDGAETQFLGNLQTSVIQGSISFVSVDSDNNSMVLVDAPLAFNTSPTFDGAVYDQNDLTTPIGQVEYLAPGAFTVNFPAAPGPQANIQVQYLPYVASLPTMILYYNNQFTVRPVPDRPYKITMDAYIKPIAFLSQDNNTQPTNPVLNQWWQYLAYGAAKKVFEDRGDYEGVAQITPEFQRQEDLVLRRTLVQRSTRQAATIWNQNGYGPAWNGNLYWGAF